VPKLSVLVNDEENLVPVMNGSKRRLENMTGGNCMKGKFTRPLHLLGGWLVVV